VWELGRKREVEVLHQVGARQERNQVEALVDDGKLALLGLVQDVVGFLELNTVAGGYEVGGHDCGDRVVELVVELDVSGCNDTNELGAKSAVLCSYCQWMIPIQDVDKA
jgi:hypothetical protein